MQKIFWVYVLLIITGFVFLVLPENEQRLLTVNKYHGPSATDAIGLLLIITSWLCMLVTAVRRRGKINDNVTRPLCVGSVLAIVAGSIWIIISMMRDADKEWIPGTIIAAGGYLVLFFGAFKK